MVHPTPTFKLNEAEDENFENLALKISVVSVHCFRSVAPSHLTHRSLYVYKQLSNSLAQAEVFPTFFLPNICNILKVNCKFPALYVVFCVAIFADYLWGEMYYLAK